MRPQTYRLDRLYHQFLKPKGLDMSHLPLLATRLYEAGFIEVYQDESLDFERYSETDKLTSRQHRDELFKLIEEII